MSAYLSHVLWFRESFPSFVLPTLRYSQLQMAESFARIVWPLEGFLRALGGLSDAFRRDLGCSWGLPDPSGGWLGQPWNILGLFRGRPD
eukprot:4953593-Pyramimonas_sp.AAC.1